MKSAVLPNCKGFEFAPRGCLLEQVIDLSGEMGFAYERSCEFYKDFHVHDRLMLVFSRGSSAMEIRTRNNLSKVRAQQTNVALVPKGLEHDDEGVSAIYDTMAFYPSDALIAATAGKMKIAPRDIEKMSAGLQTFHRSQRLNQKAQDYFHDRVVLGEKGASPDLEFLGRKLLEEAFAILFDRKKAEPSRDSLGAGDAVVARAIKFIESNLFQAIDVPDIARRSGASASTLLRSFKNEVGQTPYSYIKSRRLEEAERLLKSGNYNVGQVAMLVGYENFGAFTDAFKAKFKRLPSSYR